MADCIIGIPTFTDAPPCIEFDMTLTSLAMPINFSNQYHIVRDKVIDVARNEIVEATLANDTGPRFLFFLDNDVIMPPNSLRQLIHRLENSPPDVGAVTGVYYSKSEPGEPLIFMERGRGSHYDWRAGDYIKIWAAGCGLVVIRTQCLRDMELQKGRPWFDIDYGLHKNEKGALEARSITEDLYFYDKMAHTFAPNGKPYSLWCDTGIQAQHYERHSKRFFGLQPEEPQAQRRRPLSDKNRNMLWVGCGPRKDHFPGYNVVRTDAVEGFKPDIVAPGDMLPVNDCEYDVVYSSHLLHSFAPGDVTRVLAEWKRVLKPGGRVHIKVPDIKAALDNSKEDPSTAVSVLYVGKSGFDENLAKSYLASAGYVKVWTYTTQGELNMFGTRGE